MKLICSLKTLEFLALSKVLDVDEDKGTRFTSHVYTESYRPVTAFHVLGPREFCGEGQYTGMDLDRASE